MLPRRLFPLLAAVLLSILVAGFALTLEGTPALPPPAPLGDLAGSYYRGDGLGVNHTLKIRPKGTFTFSWDGCLGNYRSSRGSASREGHALFLLEDWVGRGDRVPDATTGRYLPVPWGKRRYLVPVADVLDFVNGVNLGLEPRDAPQGGHYLRQGDWEIPVSGLPEVPEAYRKYLVREPIEGTVRRRLPGNFGYGRYEVELTEGGGLLPGMMLVGGERDHCQLDVVSVTGSIVVGEARDGCYAPALLAGDRMSTRLTSEEWRWSQESGRRWLLGR